MARLLGSKAAGGVSYGTLFGAGLVKFAEERALAPIIGNGSLKSGIIKLVGGLAAKKFLDGGLIGNSVALGFSIDAVEDILTAVLGGGLGFGGGQATAW
jgi:hypothetical protein